MARLRTYQKEYLFVLLVLAVPFFFAKTIRITEIIAALAVFFTFHHAQIADRMQEKQAAMVTPDVDCHWKSNYYFMVKEGLWITFFLLVKSWAALSGAIIFFLYPFWRKYYRKKYPMGRNKV
jgi:phosphotransferase system  glucose/maltose/N-acetylglucosamine-specific IIC component